MTAEEICEQLGLEHSNILNIYPYGSKIYGTDDEYSDSDYIIVFRASMLPSGAFRDNAISSEDRNIQCTCYSRGGFIDAINKYEISALECIFLPKDKIVQNKMKFGITKFYKPEFIKKIISKASSSWHFATLSQKDEHTEYAMKNVFHALRILDFGIQIKEHSSIVDYSSMNDIKKKIDGEYNTFDMYDYYELFLELSEKMKS